MKRRNIFFDPMPGFLLWPIFIIVYYLVFLYLVYFGYFLGLLLYVLAVPLIILSIITGSLAVFLSLKNHSKSSPAAKFMAKIVIMIVVSIILLSSNILLWFKFTTRSSGPSFEDIMITFTLFSVLPFIFGLSAFGVASFFKITGGFIEEDRNQDMKTAYYEAMVEDELKRMK